MFDLTGNVAVVTGASVGLGRQFALALARQGADVAILARRKEKLAEVAKEVEALGVRCLPVGCDVTDVAQVQNAVQAVLDAFGTVDILINNAEAAPASRWRNFRKRSGERCFLWIWMAPSTV